MFLLLTRTYADTHFPRYNRRCIPTKVEKSGDADGKLIVDFVPTSDASGKVERIACDTVLFAIGMFWGGGISLRIFKHGASFAWLPVCERTRHCSRSKDPC